MKILFVDDIQVDRFVAKKILQDDFHVITLSSAVEAIAFAGSHPFDVALINVMLQYDLDCIALLRKLKLLSQTPFIAIAITCHIDEYRHDQVIRNGFEAVMHKPLNKSRFLQLISQNKVKATHTINMSLTNPQYDGSEC
jgi:CheY-like chemotaxis protein